MTKIVTDPKEIAQIKHLLYSLSIPPDSRGCRALAVSICLVSHNEDLLSNVTRDLYPLTAEILHTNWQCVEHNMRTAITNCWNHGGRQRYAELTTLDLEQRPCAGEFIAAIANYMVRQGYGESS